jgi:UDP-N-acetylglucosamine--N-acetylmuramyl-(pentapeptide) pyrophosphoryl-undecaprenol N-acetylglucosamine transferase
MAVAEEFLARDPANQVLFVGTARGIEARTVPAAGYPLELISAAGVRGKGSLSKIKAAAMMLYGYAQSRKVLKRFHPDFVLGVGGYASLPMVLAARGMQVPCFIHEQNAIPGMTNKILAHFATQVFITLEESAKFFPEKRILVTGNPLRRQILDMVGKVQSPPTSEKEGKKKFQLFVFGGSQGAHAINMAMVAALPELKAGVAEIEITHQTGENDLETVASAYHREGLPARVTAFISDMATEYAKADLIICRAGATTIAEVTACGKACLFIPFPHAVDDHQRRNAEALLKKDACFMMLEHELDGESLARTIRELAEDNASVERIARNSFALSRLDAAEIIVNEMIERCKSC